ncbi:hypothetical protein Q9R38_25945 [Priestia aryabhattai]|uniref:hypothetical protein n=1 Tax=Priestia aryabhattai TaxID=412384 RepID=UPI0028815887|nr:hypothetical protein [Priestia aryabhattai]MDT0149986.1 hypothetical protein [Priestia aryabhattai]MDT0155556.1 hypothetical protein [Priestia aryabhattai]
MAKYTVKSKSKGFKGSRLGIPFIQGVASFEDEKLIPHFEELGYTVEGKPEPKQAAKKPATKKKATAKKKGE